MTDIEKNLMFRYLKDNDSFSTLLKKTIDFINQEETMLISSMRTPLNFIMAYPDDVMVYWAKEGKGDYDDYNRWKSKMTQNNFI